MSVLIIQHYVTNPDTGWRWPIGCLKLQVIFRKRATHYRALEVIFRKSDIYLLALLWKIICNLGDPMSLRHPVWHFPLKLLHPRNPPNPKNQIARYLAIKNSYWDFGLIWICTKEFVFLDLVSQVVVYDSFFNLNQNLILNLYREIPSKVCRTVPTEITTPPKSTKSRNSDCSVSRGTNSNWDFG